MDTFCCHGGEFLDVKIRVPESAEDEDVDLGDDASINCEPKKEEDNSENTDEDFAAYKKHIVS